MKKMIYTVYDSVTEVYWHPFFAFNHEEAKRTIGNAVNAPADNDLSLHPEDFTLYCIGTFNDQVNEVILEPLIPVENICRCDQLITKMDSQS